MSPVPNADETSNFKVPEETLIILAARTSDNKMNTDYVNRC